MDKKKPKERYLKIPYHIFNIGGLGVCEKVLLAYIYSFGGAGCWQSNETLGKVFFTPPRTVRRWIQRIHNHIYIKSPKSYHRTMWAKSHPDVKDGIKKWAAEHEKKQTTPTKRIDDSRTNMANNPTINGQVSRPKGVIQRGQIRPTIINLTNKEITKGITTPAPLPAEATGSALLADRKKQNIETVEEFVGGNFGRGKKDKGKPLTDTEFEQKRQQQKTALLV